jgi:hypothetical protein
MLEQSNVFEGHVKPIMLICNAAAKDRYNPMCILEVPASKFVQPVGYQV